MSRRDDAREEQAPRGHTLGFLQGVLQRRTPFLEGLRDGGLGFGVTDRVLLAGFSGRNQF